MNLPNKITIARILMIFIFLIIANSDEFIPSEYIEFWKTIGFAIAIIAGITDFVDGYIARKYNMITDFGRLMDPVADKIFITAAFIVLVENKLLSGWIAVVILSREFLVTGLRLLAASKGEIIPADSTAKLKTTLQMFFLILGGIIWVGWLDKSDSICFNGDVKIFWTICVWAITVLTVYSGFMYFFRYKYLFISKTA
jgi:CDP-diacylglycerol--glycerol-3-phosphate 3-phosphatidyltransferase